MLFKYKSISLNGILNVFLNIMIVIIIINKKIKIKKDVNQLYYLIKMKNAFSMKNIVNVIRCLKNVLNIKVIILKNVNHINHQMIQKCVLI